MTFGGPRYSPCCGLHLVEIGRDTPDLLEPRRWLRCRGCGQVMVVTIQWLRDHRGRAQGIAGWQLARAEESRPPAPPGADDDIPVPHQRTRRRFSWLRGSDPFAGLDRPPS